jgi:hypothetical protein
MDFRDTKIDIIFDIDGTLADIEHRRHYVFAKPKNWKAFNAGAAYDSVNIPVALMAYNMYMCGHRIILCSGRTSDMRTVTETWLSENKIHYNRLYMRPEKDYRSDDIVKEELLDQIIKDGFDPKCVFDDRKRVVDMWRRRGIPCFQVAEGDF